MLTATNLKVNSPAIAADPQGEITLKRLYSRPSQSQLVIKESSWRFKLGQITVNEEDVKSIENAEFIWKNLIVKGQCTVIAARANGGKTTVIMQACAEMSKAGSEVIYFDLDSGASGLKAHFAHAQKSGYTIIAPDLKVGRGNADVTDVLHQMADSGSDLSNTVIVLDTLKKMYEVLNKGAAKEFFELTRKLTVQGATVILLAHTNKHLDANGKQLFEGTGDVRNDVDCLIYFDTTKDAQGVITGTADLDKNRFAGMTPISFKIHPNRSIEFLDDIVDVKSMMEANSLLVDNVQLVKAIIKALYTKTMSVRELSEFIREDGGSWSRAAVNGAVQLLCRADIGKLRQISAKARGFVYALAEKPEPIN